MKKLFIMLLVFSLCSMFALADDTTWTFDSDEEGWNNGGWSTTISHDSVEGHDAAGAIDCTDTDGYYGVRNTVTIGASDPNYTIEAWCKLVSLPGGTATGGLNLDTWDLDTSGATSVPFDDSVTDSWQSQTQSGTADSTASGYIMIWGGASGESGDSHTVQYYLDDISYTEGSRVIDWGLYQE